MFLIEFPKSRNKISHIPNKVRVCGHNFVPFQVSHPEAYGKFSITTNGQSLMNFQMELLAVTIMNKVPVKKVDVASWEAGLNQPLDVKNAPKMVKHSATTVYRIVTLVVSGILTSQ
jgi:hypothetical protein